MKHIYVLFFLFISTFGFSQEELFRGIIYADSIGTTQVNIVNLTQETGSTNLTDGRFQIAAKEGDEIIFSSVQYQPYQITVTQKMLQNEENKIFLFLEVNQLNEVKISNIDLTGDLKRDAANMDVYVFDPTSVGLPNAAPVMSVEDRRLYTAQSGGPVGLLIDVLSGRLAMLKRMKEYAELDALVLKAKNMVSTKFLVNDLFIPENYIDDFFYFCAKDNSFKSFVATANKLEFIEFLTRKKQAYFSFKKWE